MTVADALLEFSYPEQRSFNKLVRYLGYEACACYRLEGRDLVLALADDHAARELWSAKIALDNYDYTSNRKLGLPVGWQDFSAITQKATSWSKNVYAYFPVQDLWVQKQVFLVRGDPRALPKVSTLDGNFEALAKRFLLWFENEDLREFLNEKAFDEHVRRMSFDIRSLVDHELRTPLTVMLGYLSMMGKDPQRSENDRFTLDVVLGEVRKMTNSLNRLGVAFQKTSERAPKPGSLPQVPLAPLVEDAQREVMGKQILTKKNLTPTFQTEIAKGCEAIAVSGEARLLAMSIAEVIHNAVVHSELGKICIRISQSDESAVLDVENLQEGLPYGFDDLIFLRFFQGGSPSTGHHRGFGLGLFLARHITEQHLGKLIYLRRGSEQGGFFRFVWPLTRSAPALKGAS